MFSQLDLPELAKVVERCTVKSLKAGEYLMREHDLGKEMYMVLDGELNVEHNNVLLANLKKGDHVGEMALVTGHPRSASVQATKDCTLLCMSDAQLAQILRYEPELGVKLLFSLSQGLSQRLDRANAKVS